MLPERGGEPMDPAPGTRVHRAIVSSHTIGRRSFLFLVFHTRAARALLFTRTLNYSLVASVLRGVGAPRTITVTAAPQRALRAVTHAFFVCLSLGASSFVSTRSTPSAVHS